MQSAAVAAHLDDALAGQLRVAPCTMKAAQRFVREWHRHLPELQGGLFAASCVDPNGETVAVAVAGNPPRVWQGTGRVVISRVAASVEANACGMLYGALSRAAQALGYREAWTYTLPEECGKTLRGAGFVDMGHTAGGEWSRQGRERAPAVRPDAKRRWVRFLDKRPAILDRIRAGWSRQTSYWPTTWTPENPAHGQCAVTALLIQSLFGGPIVIGRMHGETHFWNTVDGRSLDLTASQFPKSATRFYIGEIDRDDLLANADTTARFNRLRQAFLEAA